MFIYFKEFARRALGKIEKLARWEQENDVPVSRETQSAFREASIKAGYDLLYYVQYNIHIWSHRKACVPVSLYRFNMFIFFYLVVRVFLTLCVGFDLVNLFVSISQLAAMVFKRLVFENRKKIKPVFKPKTKLPNVITSPLLQCYLIL